MFYIVGLGNPGEQYAETRHNIGWHIMDTCVSAWGLATPVDSAAVAGRITTGVVAGEEVQVLYPGTYMNNSGSAVKKLVPSEQTRQLLVIHDDIDLPWGEIKLVQGRGAGGNNGVQSIIDKLGSKEFARLRVGIAPKSFWTGKIKRPAGGGPLERFVLKKFSTTEKKQLPEVATSAQLVIEAVLEHGVAQAMNTYNTKVS